MTKKPLPTVLLVLAGMLVGLVCWFIAFLIGGVPLVMSDYFLVALLGFVVVPYVMGIAFPCVYFHRRNKTLRGVSEPWSSEVNAPGSTAG